MPLSNYNNGISRYSVLKQIYLPNECPAYDIKQSDGEAPVLLELWGMQSIFLLLSLPVLLWLGAVASKRVLSTTQKKLNYLLM